MADTYFTDPYKKFYDKLKRSSINAKAKTTSEAAALVLSTIKRLQSQISSAIWEELGYAELANVSTPALQNRVSILNENISNVLVKACTLSMNSLLPTLQLLYDADERYRAASAELESLSEPDAKKEPDKHGEYLANKKKLEEAISVLVTKTIPGLKAAADGKIEEIKSLNGNIKNFELDSSGNIVEIEGLTLTEDEKAFVAALEKSMENFASENGTSYSTELTSLSLLYNNGRTKIYNGGQEYGYARKVLTSHGKLVTVFQQAWNENLSQKKGVGTLRESGCSYNALAAILSARYPDVTPESLFKTAGGTYMHASTIKKLVENITDGAVKVGYRDTYTTQAARKAKIIQEIQRGNMAICTVQRGPDAKYTKKGHWVGIVDYDPSTDSFFISDSADTNNANAGPIKADEFLAKYEVNTNIIYLSDTSGYNDELAIRNA